MSILNNASIMNLNGIISPGITSLTQGDISEEELSSLSQVDKSSLYFIVNDVLLNETSLLNIKSNWILISKWN